MAIYAIGDIQGCYDEMMQLLDKLRFNKRLDRILFTGDLVNRGPKSLESLRHVKSMGRRNNSILGNHDLHLLAIANGVGKQQDISPDLMRILTAPDRDSLLEWLRQRPVVIYDKKRKFLISHAGVYPGWTLEETLQYARELEEVIRGRRFHEFLYNMYGNTPDKWSPRLSGWDRIRFIVNAFTRMRYCDSHLKLLFDYKRGPQSRPEGYLPWYDLPRKFDPSVKIIFGHWSTLGHLDYKEVISIDTGCLWGGYLTAVRLDKDLNKGAELIQIKCRQHQKPRKNEK